MAVGPEGPRRRAQGLLTGPRPPYGPVVAEEHRVEVSEVMAPFLAWEVRG